MRLWQRSWISRFAKSHRFSKLWRSLNILKKYHKKNGLLALYRFILKFCEKWCSIASYTVKDLHLGKIPLKIYDYGWNSSKSTRRED